MHIPRNLTPTCSFRLSHQRSQRWCPDKGLHLGNGPKMGTPTKANKLNECDEVLVGEKDYSYNKDVGSAQPRNDYLALREGHYTHEPRAMTMKLWEP